MLVGLLMLIVKKSLTGKAVLAVIFVAMLMGWITQVSVTTTCRMPSGQISWADIGDVCTCHRKFDTPRTQILTNTLASIIATIFGSQ